MRYLLLILMISVLLTLNLNKKYVIKVVLLFDFIKFIKGKVQ